MNGGQHAVASTGGLLCGIRLRRPHLAHTDDVGVVPQGHVQQHILIDILLGVLALTGDGVDDAVAHPVIFLPHQVQLTGAVLDGENTLVVRDGGQEPACHRSLAGTGGPGNADGNAVTQAGGQKVQHGACGCSTFYEVLFLHILRVDDTDGCRDAHILVHQRGLEDRDADVLAEMAQDGGTGIVQHHTADMEHTADHIDGVFRAVEMFLQLDRFAIGVQHLDIPPRVHINLLNAGSEDVLGEQAELGHLRVEGVHQLVAGIAFDRDAPVLHIFGDVPLDLRFGVLAAALGDEGGILAGDIFLHILQNSIEILFLTFRGEEEGVRPMAACRLCIQGPPGEILRHVHAICGISFNPCPIISWGVTQRLIRGLGFSNAGFMLILTHIAAYRVVRAEIEGEFFLPPVRTCRDMRRSGFLRRRFGSEQGLTSLLA